MPTEADTCRTYVAPALYAAGWKDDQIAEQRTFTDGRILVAGLGWNKNMGTVEFHASHLLHADTTHTKAGQSTGVV